MLIIGIHDSTQNFSMSVLYNGIIYAIELERLIGLKNGIYKDSNNEFFMQQYSLWIWTHLWRDIFTIGEYWIYLMFNYFSTYLWIHKEDIDLLVVSSGKNYKNIFWERKIVVPTSHHLIHAYSTYFLSWFHSSNILVIDGAWYDTTKKLIELQSMYLVDKKLISILNTNYANIDQNIGIGIAYERVSLFLWLSEWKLMGLTWYGKNLTRYNFFDLFEGSVFLKANLHDVFCHRVAFLKYFWLQSNFERNWYFDEKIMDFAYSFQREVEEAILYLADYLYQKNPSENLCYAGWVALNCLTNSRIITELRYKNIFIQPAANDSGISLWNVLYWYYQIFWWTEKISLCNDNYWLWKNYPVVLDILDEFSDFISYQEVSENVLIKEISEKIKQKKVCSIFRWWSEFWPRALWNRSIIASPYIKDISNILNHIKDREYWRPFGIMILYENQESFFEKEIESKYMLFTNRLNKYWISHFTHISHTDKSIRLQTIDNTNDFYYRLLWELKNAELHWIINTSLNWRWEPILETPKQAINFFLEKDWLDYFFLENYIISKKSGLNEGVYKKTSSSNLDFLKTSIKSIKTIIRKNTWLKDKDIFVDIDIYSMTLIISIIEGSLLIWKIKWSISSTKSSLEEMVIEVDNLTYQSLLNRINENIITYQSQLHIFFMLLKRRFLFWIQ